MLPTLENFLLAFIPLFVAIDPLGLIPIFQGLTTNVSAAERHKITNQSTLTAAGVGIFFLFLGKFIFNALHISPADFQIAGGLILLALASRELITLDKQTTILVEDFGVVPLGIPLMAGPATLTTLMFLADTVGFAASLTALVANLLLTNLLFRSSEPVTRFLGKTTLRAISKIIALLLVAIAVHIIRLGFQGV